MQWQFWRTQYPTQATGTHASRTRLNFHLRHWSQNTFHFAGVGAKNVTLGVPRLKVGCWIEALQEMLPWFEQSFFLNLLATRHMARANLSPRQTPDAPSDCTVSHFSARKVRPAESCERAMLIRKTGADQRGEGSEDAFLGPAPNN